MAVKAFGVKSAKEFREAAARREHAERLRQHSLARTENSTQSNNSHAQQSAFRFKGQFKWRPPMHRGIVEGLIQQLKDGKQIVNARDSEGRYQYEVIRSGTDAGKIMFQIIKLVGEQGERPMGRFTVNLKEPVVRQID
ncbi:Uncharacterised protein [uncultured archaeon]|nr:Uncharacterised protein [uncultured archaeon]